MGKLLSGAVLIAAFFVWGCGSEEEKKTGAETATSWEFKKVDSLQFEIIGRPIFTDAEFGKILLYDGQKQEFIILDEDGTLINRFSKSGDNPDSFGFNLLLPGFLSESEIMMAGTLGIFIYDLSGNLVKKIPHPEAQSGGVFTSIPGKSIDHFYRNGENKILSKSFRTFDYRLSDEEFYKKLRGLEVIDSQSGQARALAPFPPKSRFLNGNGFIQSDFEPTFAANDSMVYVVFAGDPVLHQYKWSGDSLTLEKSIELMLPNFGEITGQPLKMLEGIGASTDMLTASLRKVVGWRDKVLVQFFPGFSTEESLALTEDYRSGDEEAAKSKISKLNSERKMGIAVVDPLEAKQLGIIEFPTWLNPTGFSLDGDNFWFQKAFNPDAEDDFIKLYKVQMIEK